MRAWIKKLIAEAIQENFPRMTIYIDGVKTKSIHLENCHFRESTIEIHDVDTDANLRLEGCSFDNPGLKKNESCITRKRNKN